MDMRIHKLLNILLPPIAVLMMLLACPLFLLFQVVSALQSFRRKEDVARKVVLITGASSGIGEHMTYEYAKRGARLALVARRKDRLVAVAEKARRLGSPDAMVICGDVSKLEDCKSFVDETVNHFGQLDHLVNNAGITQIKSFGNAADLSGGRQLMDINFWGSVYGSHFAAPHLKKSKGKIIAISSTASMIPLPRAHFYCASKAALTSFFETLKIEYGSDIGITIVSPGLVESEMVNTHNVSTMGWRFMPIEPTEGCAKAIVEKACGGCPYILEPSWIRVVLWFKQYYTQLCIWSLRRIHLYSRASKKRV